MSFWLQRLWIVVGWTRRSERVDRPEWGACVVIIWPQSWFLGRHSGRWRVITSFSWLFNWYSKSWWARGWVWRRMWRVFWARKIVIQYPLISTRIRFLLWFQKIAANLFVPILYLLIIALHLLPLDRLEIHAREYIRLVLLFVGIGRAAAEEAEAARFGRLILSRLMLHWLELSAIICRSSLSTRTSIRLTIWLPPIDFTAVDWRALSQIKYSIKQFS